ncbi:MAG: hypothetical protein LBB14_02330, partial [Puniceicoccales bacterium]|nr:hypothetical protein [Puniceicoccales bacterium]
MGLCSLVFDFRDNHRELIVNMSTTNNIRTEAKKGWSQFALRGEQGGMKIFDAPDLKNSNAIVTAVLDCGSGVIGLDANVDFSSDKANREKVFKAIKNPAIVAFFLSMLERKKFRVVDIKGAPDGVDLSTIAKIIEDEIYDSVNKDVLQQCTFLCGVPLHLTSDANSRERVGEVPIFLRKKAVESLIGAPKNGANYTAEEISSFSAVASDVMLGGDGPAIAALSVVAGSFLKTTDAFYRALKRSFLANDTRPIGSGSTHISQDIKTNGLNSFFCTDLDEAPSKCPSSSSTWENVLTFTLERGLGLHIPNEKLREDKMKSRVEHILRHATDSALVRLIIDEVSDGVREKFVATMWNHLAGLVKNGDMAEAGRILGNLPKEAFRKLGVKG